MVSNNELKYNFNAKKNAKKQFYVYESVVMKDKTEEEKADYLVAYFDREAFEYSLDNVVEDNITNQEAGSFQKAKIALMEKLLLWNQPTLDPRLGRASNPSEGSRR